MATRGSDGAGFWWLVIGCAVAWYFWKSNDRWEGFVYPDRTNLTKHYSAGEHKTLEDCRAQATFMLKQMNAIYSGDYECGLNCRSEDGLAGVKICKETER